MAAITWAHVQLIAPELSAVVLDAQTLILSHVNEALSVSVFGGEDAGKTKLARVFLAAHYGSRTLSGGAELGEVSSETVGQIKRDYVTSGVSAELSGAGLRSTTYGANYLSLVETSGARGPVLL